MPVELYMLDKLKARIQLAREIDGLQHKVKKEKHERNWLKEAAEAMEIELDSDLARCVPGHPSLSLARALTNSYSVSITMSVH